MQQLFHSHHIFLTIKIPLNSTCKINVYEILNISCCWREEVAFSRWIQTVEDLNGSSTHVQCGIPNPFVRLIENAQTTNHFHLTVQHRFLACSTINFCITYIVAKKVCEPLEITWT